MHLFLNGLGASAGAGLTYLYNVVPCLSALPDVQTTLALQANLRNKFCVSPRVNTIDIEVPQGTARRFWFEQKHLPELVHNSSADVLISAGNFAVRNSPVPQILLSGNSLYTSRDFYRDLTRRRDYRLWLDTRIKGAFARESVGWADCTIAPSESYAADLRQWAKGKVIAIHHGFDREVFFGDLSPLPRHVEEKLTAADGCLQLLFVSHYNYYRNFETLFRAVAILRRDRKVRLFLTCRLNNQETPGSYKTEIAAALIRRLGIESEVVELGAIPYRQLHQLYRQCHIYVTPAYTETFAHPLVEAMASGLPIVASDLPVHKEVCGESARFFPRFSPESLASAVSEIADSPTLKDDLAAAGKRRSQDFSWANHVTKLLGLVRTLRQAA